MRTLPKALLIISVASLVASLTGPGSEVWFGILKPVAALSFMVAYIVHIVSRLDPEQYAADQKLRDDLSHGKGPAEPLRLPIPAKAAA